MEANNLIGKVDPTTGQRTGGFFDERGRVRTQKFRKEKSDGFWCPLSYLDYIGGAEQPRPTEGTVLTEFLGQKICQKYVTEKTKTNTQQKKKTQKEKFPFFFEHEETEQLAYNIKDIKTGAIVTGKQIGRASCRERVSSPV